MSDVESCLSTVNQPTNLNFFADSLKSLDFYFHRGVLLMATRNPARKPVDMVIYHIIYGPGFSTIQPVVGCLGFLVAINNISYPIPSLVSTFIAKRISLVVFVVHHEIKAKSEGKWMDFPIFSDLVVTTFDKDKCGCGNL